MDFYGPDETKYLTIETHGRKKSINVVFGI
jgi:hypothetical protein